MILSYIRTVILYLVLILVIRLMGKRQIGEMEPAEFVVTMLVANLAAIPMQDAGIPLLTGLIPILTVLGVELLDEAAHSCRVTVPDNQLSLAIGNKGQNARLAAKLTGWRIDIKSQSQAEAALLGGEGEPAAEESESAPAE